STRRRMRQLQTDYQWAEQLVFRKNGHQLIIVGVKYVGGVTRSMSVQTLDLALVEPLPDPWLSIEGKALIVADGKGQRIGMARQFEYSLDVISVCKFKRDLPPRFRSLQSQMHGVNHVAIESRAKMLAAAGNVRADESEFRTYVIDESELGTYVFDQIPPPESYCICVWDIQSGVMRNRFPVYPLEALALSPQGGHLATADKTGINLRLYEVNDHPVCFSLDYNDAFRLAFSERGRYLASGGRSIVIWDVAAKRRVATFRGQDEDVPSLAFSPDERILAVARTDGPVEFWDVQTGQLVRRYEWNIGRLGAIAFAPDGLTCAVAGDRGRIVIWDVDE
ncbi:MAG: WD40 repeat domain-containing protein, partial [Gemmataceae bacterium]